MANDKYEEPIKQVLGLGAPYPMVVLPVDGEYWLEGNYHVLSKDGNDRPLYPSIDMSRCLLHEHDNIYNYRKNFAGKEHINYAGEDLQLGPILMSVLLEQKTTSGACDQYHVIIRTKSKSYFRIIPSDSIANEIPGPRDFIRYMVGQEPDVDHFHPIALPRASDDLIRFDEHTASNCHKVGVLYQNFGQINEEDYLQNQEISPAFQEFMDLIGEKVNLKDFPHYRGGLDVKYGQTGESSYYTNFKDRELMFHVAPLLPFTPNDSQQLSRKRHIGNDVVTLVFQEANTPFSPSSIRSHVLHVFVIVQVENPNTDDTCYKVSVTAKEGVPKFAPSLPNPCIFKKGPEFRDFLLTKVINGEAAALKCEKFSVLGERTRSTLLEQIVNELITKNEKLLEDFIDLNNDSPQKNNGFLSTFRSAWSKNGRTASTSSSSSPATLKSSKNLGQSLSLNDLTLLEVEDGKKDVKISSKEKKRLKKKGTHNNLVTILKTQSFNIDNYTDIYTSGNELSPKLRPRGAYQVERERPKSTTFNIEQNNNNNNNNSISTNGGVEQLSLSHSFPRNTLSFSPQTRALLVGSSSSPVVPNGHHHHHSTNHHAPISPKPETDEKINNDTYTQALALANTEVEKLQTEVNKLKLDKMDLVRQNVIHQREIKKLSERYSSTRDDSAQLRGGGGGGGSKEQHRKEKRKSTLLVTSTEFV